ncbi:YadA-like family protein [Qipengyuania sp. XHP0207]|uniref:YadA C-terminal domain-containing protein n=1 Tax=Qipengyuania sp. XHP0207 TaxID=3038078 RepID=UPI00241F35D2|nr:YadA-like family protein [Qipengyuania sp. XHP0207]MDG5749272.1 YadA-like family protein [Qipengyuania sp. XHP0207]
MKFEINSGRGALAVGLMAGTAAIALTATPAAAQEACERFPDGYYQCNDPAANDFDGFYEGGFQINGSGDGTYDNLEEKIATSAPTEAEVEAAEENVATATETATALNGAVTAVNATLTEENLEAFEAVETEEADLAAAQAAQEAAEEDATAAQAAFDSAAEDLTEANASVTNAQVAAANAQDDVDAAQAAFDADDSQENLEALNEALVARAEAQQNLAAAEAERAEALAVANTASENLTAAQEDLAAAQLATATAADDFADALADLDTSLASNDDFVEAIEEAGFTANAGGLTNLNNAAETATANQTAAEAQLAGLDDVQNTFIRAQDVLVDAAENENAAIAAASQALLGDPRAAETNSDVEVIAALVDHEGRISANEDAIVELDGRVTANEAAIVDLDGRVTANEAAIVDLDERVTSNTERLDVVEETLVEYDERITANSDAIVAEAETRAAADAELLGRITDEENARIAGDAALQGQIDTLSGRVGAIETRLEDFDDRISSSTATAIAMGGMAFLPDMKFNLAVSGGFYEGAQAIAANVGVRVSNNVAVTAGVGGGLNKNGKVGGRVGVIFGF